MPRITNLFNEKVYAYQLSNEVYENERVIIHDIFKIIGEKINKINFIDANENYDLFKVNCTNNNFYLKLSLEKNPSFLKEEIILNENFRTFLCPEPFGCGSLKNFEEMSYLVTSSLESPSLREFSINNLVNPFNSSVYFFNSLSNFQCKEITLPDFNSYIKNYLDFDIFKISDIEANHIENNKKIAEITKKQVVILQQILKEKFSNLPSNIKYFCHGNLNPSTILTNGGNLNFINFENSYIGDPLFEILNLKYEFFYSDSFENSLIENYQTISDNKLDLTHIKEYKQICSYWNLLKICVDYLREVFILKSTKQNKILNLAIKLSKNYDRFYQLPDFNKTFKPIAELFVESVI